MDRGERDAGRYAQQERMELEAERERREDARDAALSNDGQTTYVVTIQATEGTLSLADAEALVAELLAFDAYGDGSLRVTVTPIREET